MINGVPHHFRKPPYPEASWVMYFLGPWLGSLPHQLAAKIEANDYGL